MVGLSENLPILKNFKPFRKYAEYFNAIEFSVDPALWLILSLLAAVFAAIIAWFLATQMKMTQGLQLGAMFFLVIVDLLAGFPYLKAQDRIDKIEEDLPDAMKQIADTLKAGGTFEYALREVALSQYGPLKKELNETLKKLEDGQNFENALMTLYHNIDSRLVQRTVTIIIDSVAAGAALTNVLDEIAEDVRSTHRINKERKSKTTMQVIFMFAAGGVIAPIIFGFTSTIAGILTSVPGSGTSEATRDAALQAIGMIQNSIQAYLFIEVFFTSVMISLIRDGKITKSIIYFPLLLCMAYLSYLGASIVSGFLVGGIK